MASEELVLTEEGNQKGSEIFFRGKEKVNEEEEDLMNLLASMPPSKGIVRSDYLLRISRMSPLSSNSTNSITEESLRRGFKERTKRFSSNLRNLDDRFRRTLRGAFEEEFITFIDTKGDS